MTLQKSLLFPGDNLPVTFTHMSYNLRLGIASAPLDKTAKRINYLTLSSEVALLASLPSVT
jgi:hypothetical protein